MNKLFLACMLSFTIAQNDTIGDFDQDGLSYDETTRAERRESMVIWRLTEDLDLSRQKSFFQGSVNTELNLPNLIRMRERF